MPRYVAVLAAESDVRFRDEPVPFRADDFPTAVGRVDLIFRTRYADEGFAAAVPREMWIDARGDIDNDVPLIDVVSAYTQAAANLLPTLALSANAWIGDVEPKIAYEATPGSTSREYFQNFLRETRGTLPPTRRIIDVPATVSLLRALQSHSARDRIARASAQYALALGHWLPGHETMAMAHLFIGMEALTLVARDRELARQGITAEQLATAWGIALVDNWMGRLDAEVRRRILFQGDSVTARTAREARNGFTHSFLDFKIVRELAEDVAETTAHFLRHAILDLSGMDSGARDVLLATPFDKPLHSYLRKYLWGSLDGEGEELAAPDQEYPILEWRSAMKSFATHPDEPDRFRAQPNDTFTLRAAVGIGFKPRRWELWAAASSGASMDRAEGTDETSEVELQPPSFADLLGDVERLVTNLGGGVLMERPRYDLDVLALFDRCRSRLSAVRALIQRRLPQEAILLSASVFRDSLLLGSLASVDDERRGELLLGQRLSDLSDLEEIIHAASELRGSDATHELAAIDKQRKEMAAFAANLDLAINPWNPELTALAVEQNRVSHYVEVRLAEHFAYAISAASQMRSEQTSPDTAMVGGPHADAAHWEKPAALIAANSALYAARAMCAIFDWLEPPELAHLVGRVADLGDETDTR